MHGVMDMKMYRKFAWGKGYERYAVIMGWAHGNVVWMVMF
jgi:hypothetical protein